MDVTGSDIFGIRCFREDRPWDIRGMDLQRNKQDISEMNAVQLITLNTQRLSMLFRYNSLGCAK